MPMKTTLNISLPTKEGLGWMVYLRKSIKLKNHIIIHKIISTFDQKIVFILLDFLYIQYPIANTIFIIFVVFLLLHLCINCTKHLYIVVTFQKSFKISIQNSHF